IAVIIAAVLALILFSTGMFAVRESLPTKPHITETEAVQFAEANFRAKNQGIEWVKVYYSLISIRSGEARAVPLLYIHLNGTQFHIDPTDYSIMGPGCIPSSYNQLCFIKGNAIDYLKGH